jgi:molybdopterin synthase sulfur carrier subunit
MVTVEFLGPIGQKPLNMQAKTLADVATELQKDEALKVWLESAAVAVNDVLTSDLNFALKDGDKVSLLPPVCGG